MDGIRPCAVGFKIDATTVRDTEAERHCIDSFSSEKLTNKPMSSEIPTAQIPQRNGFTITELLVVILIIAVLFAIFVPLVGNSRKKARQIETTGRMSALQRAFVSFASDNQNRIPVAYSVTKDSQGRTYGSWGNQLFRDGYLPETAKTVAECEVMGCAQQLKDFPAATTKYTFGMNELLGDHPNPNKAPHGARRTIQVDFQARTALIMHGVWNGSSFSGSANQTYPSMVKPVFGDNGVLVGFVDGHIALLPLTDIPSEITSDRGSNFWLGRSGN